MIILKFKDHRLESTYREQKADFLSDLSQLQAVRLFVQQLCQETPGNEEELNLQLQLVINEIFCNIVKHGYNGASNGEIIISSRTTSHGIYITLSDKGTPFNPMEMNFPNLTGHKDNGFGFYIIQKLVDLISYIPKTVNDPWNHFRIYKRFFLGENDMNLIHVIDGQTLIITPQDKTLDAKNAPLFKESVLELIESSGLSQVVLNLCHLQFIDSSGLGTFLSIQRALNSHNAILKLCHLNAPIQTMFQIVSMHRIFNITKTSEEAIQSF